MSIDFSQDKWTFFHIFSCSWSSAVSYSSETCHHLFLRTAYGIHQGFNTSGQLCIQLYFYKALLQDKSSSLEDDPTHILSSRKF